MRKGEEGPPLQCRACTLNSEFRVESTSPRRNSSDSPLPPFRQATGLAGSEEGGEGGGEEGGEEGGGSEERGGEGPPPAGVPRTVRGRTPETFRLKLSA